MFYKQRQLHDINCDIVDIATNVSRLCLDIEKKAIAGVCTEWPWAVLLLTHDHSLGLQVDPEQFHLASQALALTFRAGFRRILGIQLQLICC